MYLYLPTQTQWWLHLVVQSQMTFNVSGLWEIKKNEIAVCWHKHLQLLMDGTFPSTCFQNNIDAARGPSALATGIWVVFAVQTRDLCCKFRLSVGRVEKPRILWLLSWLSVGWAAGPAGTLAWNQAAAFLHSIWWNKSKCSEGACWSHGINIFLKEKVRLETFRL